MHYLYPRQVGWICRGALGWMEIFRFSATCVCASEWERGSVCECVCDWRSSGWKTKMKETASGFWLCDPSVGGVTLKFLLLPGRHPRWPAGAPRVFAYVCSRIFESTSKHTYAGSNIWEASLTQLLASKPWNSAQLHAARRCVWRSNPLISLINISEL